MKSSIYGGLEARSLGSVNEPAESAMLMPTSRQKRHYLEALLPLLAALRRRSGLPHKIVLDEAHYFLATSHGADRIDAQLAGYILVTYRISTLDPAIRGTCDSVVLVSRETDAMESAELARLCRPADAVAVPPSTFGNWPSTKRRAHSPHGVERW